jgi:hypothetical protein
LHAQHLLSGSDISFVSSLKRYPKGFEVKYINRNLTLRPNPNDFIRKLLLGQDSNLIYDVYIPSSTCAVSVKAFKFVNGFDVNLRRLEDVDLAIKFAQENMEFSWTSEIGVTRQYTENIYKGNGIDSFFEEILIRKYVPLLSKKELKSALIHMQTRKLYFSHRYFSFLIHVLKNPIYLIYSVHRIFRFIKRLYHDFRKFT